MTRASSIFSSETVDPPGFRLRGAAFASPKMAGWMDPADRPAFIKAVGEIANPNATYYKDGNYTPVGPDSAGVAPGGEAQRQRIPRDNELIAAREYRLRGPRGGILELTGVPSGQWASRIEVFLTSELRAEPGRVRVEPLASDPRGETFAVKIGVERLGRLRITESQAAAQDEQEMLGMLAKANIQGITAADDRGTVSAGRGSERAAVLTHGGMTVDELAIAMRSATDVEQTKQLQAQLNSAVVRIAEGMAELHNHYSQGFMTPSAKSAHVARVRALLEDPQVRQRLGTRYEAVKLRFDAVAQQFLAANIDATVAHGRAESSSFAVDGYNKDRNEWETLKADNLKEFKRNAAEAGASSGERDVVQFLESLHRSGMQPDVAERSAETFIRAYARSRRHRAASRDRQVATAFFELDVLLSRARDGKSTAVDLREAR